MCKYEMDLMSIVEDTERTRFCPQTDRRTDRRTDGQGDTSIPPYQLRWSGGYNNGTYDTGHLVTIARLQSWYPQVPAIIAKTLYVTNMSIGVTLLWRHNGRDDISNHQGHVLLQRSYAVARISANGSTVFNESYAPIS